MQHDMKIITEVNKAGQNATRWSGHWSTLQARADRPEIMDGFLENWDAERLTFRNELIDRGWKDAGYAAPYHWKLIKKGHLLEYVEGDVYITRTEERPMTPGEQEIAEALDKTIKP